MLTNTIAMRQNINAVENGQYGLGGPDSEGAMRHLQGGIFARVCVAFMNERRGTSKDVPLPSERSANPWRLVHHLGGWYRGLLNIRRAFTMQQTQPSIGAPAPIPILSIVQNKVTALSTDVAKFFGKSHFHVVRDIESLLERLPVSRASNFGVSTISVESNLKNAPEKIIKAYRMTRDGFTLLVMGWTGEKALQFKLAWLEAFNKMEEELRGKQQLPTLPPSSPLGKSVAPEISVAISDAMGHNALGFDSPKHEAHGAKKSSGAIFMRKGSPMGETDGASSDAPSPCARSVNPSVSPTRLTAGGGSYNLHKEPIMQTNVGSIQPVRINFNDLTLRVFNINNEPWFAATDVCAGLELTNPSKAISNLRACERSNLKLGRGGSLNIINESGLYTLILRCDAAIKEGTAAFNFRVKVTDEILPSIRKNGSYNSVPTLPPSSPLGKSVAPAIAATPMTQEQLDAVRAVIQKRFPDNKEALRAFSVLQHNFRVVSYRQIPQARFEEALEFAGNLVLSKPKVRRPKALAAPVKIKKSIPPIPLNGTYLIQSYSGDLSIKQLTSDWSLIKAGDHDWMKDYCRYGMPPEMIPEVMQILLHRLKNNI